MKIKNNTLTIQSEKITKYDKISTGYSFQLK